MPIPVIDIFAGPGGLGEGFSSVLNARNEREFKIALSIEKEKYAHETLTLRSFYRQFEIDEAPDDYYKFLRGEITKEELYQRWPEEIKRAREEAWHATLGDGDGAVSNSEVDKRIELSIGDAENWVLIGGPPCQAYSVAGRNRRKVLFLDESEDERVGLYKQYLRILAVHNPPVFVMENVKGLLSAATKESRIFSNILNDLSDPVSAYLSVSNQNGKPLICPGYKIYSLVVPPDFDEDGNLQYHQKDYVICTENHGVPQTRHRIILLGIRRDIDVVPGTLDHHEEVGISQVLSDLPPLRSGLSKTKNSNENWIGNLLQLRHNLLLDKIEEDVKNEMIKHLDMLQVSEHGVGNEFIPGKFKSTFRPDWFGDRKLEGVCNHSARGHMESDLLRYFFMSSYAKVKGMSPVLKDFPVFLLPKHKNVFKTDGSVTKKFPDRFRVQLASKASKTITSHISQDGHYYVHYDPGQCRSLTVREAARIQTFPDNYFFCGPKTQQFIQVGNAVPPILATEIAKIVQDLFVRWENVKEVKDCQIVTTQYDAD